MTILMTGASGFLGKICVPILSKGNKLISLGRQNYNNIVADLIDEIPDLPLVDVVIHAAGKAHVYPKTEAEKKEFFDINVNGTSHLLSALEKQSVKAIVYISSVSVYGLEQGNDIAEDTPLRGGSPYALSKIEAETLILNWCTQHHVDYLILRLPLIAGSKPLGNLGKMMDAIKRGRYLRIAKGEAHKSIVLGTDVSELILNWLQDTNRPSGIYNLTDGEHPSFFALEEGLKKMLDANTIWSVPAWFGSFLGKLGDRIQGFPVNSGTIRKITGTFTFSDAKARKELGWLPRPVLKHLHELL